MRLCKNNIKNVYISRVVTFSRYCSLCISTISNYFYDHILGSKKFCLKMRSIFQDLFGIVRQWRLDIYFPYFFMQSSKVIINRRFISTQNSLFILFMFFTPDLDPKINFPVSLNLKLKLLFLWSKALYYIKFPTRSFNHSDQIHFCLTK